MRASVSTSDINISRLLERHPDVVLVQAPTGDNAIQIDQNGWIRQLVIGDSSVEVAGLVETMDNNPMVCADIVSVPGPASTLALIALEPLIRAGILHDSPAIQIAGTREENIEGFLQKIGWFDGAAISYGEEDLGTVVATNVIALVPAEISDVEIIDLYRESFGRSLYVREFIGGEWDGSLVAGKPFACYRITVHPATTSRLVTIQVIADKDGKCGAAQIVHAMNVMCGFEECQGIPD